MTDPLTLVAMLTAWADEKPDERSFDIRYLPSAEPAPWAIDLENNDTQAAVHVDCHETLERAVNHALSRARKDEAL